MTKLGGMLNADRLIKKFKKLEKMKLAEGLEKSARFVQQQAKQLAPVDTAQLQNSIFYRVKETPKGFIGIVYTNNEYAPFVEFGTGPIGRANHEGVAPGINLRYSPTGWSYFDEAKQEWIHTKGQKAQPFMYPAIHNNHKKIKDFIAKEVNQIIKESKK